MHCEMMTRNPLAQYARNVTSQFGEDGIVAEILQRIGVRNHTCVEFGAWDGKHLSNTWDLWHNQGWNAVLIEGEGERYRKLKESLKAYPAVNAVQAFVTPKGENDLDQILSLAKMPTDLDLLSIDIDGNEYYVWRQLTKFQSRIVVIEHNPTIPPELDLVQPLDEYFGASARALTRLAHEKGYGLASCTETNCIFVYREDFKALGFEEPLLEDIFPRNNLTYVVNAYDGAMFLNRNPTYSRQITELDVGVLMEELRRTLGIRKTTPLGRNVAPETLTSVKVFAIPNNAVPRIIWARALSVLKGRIARFPLVSSIRSRWHDRKQINDWIAAGTPVPPPHLIKQRVLRSYAKWYGISVLVETGTFMGDMVEAIQRHFGRVFSIELSPELYRRAHERFATCQNVQILQGDSTAVLPKVLEQIREPALFWLDGHYSEGITALGERETPILAELDHILRHSVKEHVILIDDARCFNGTHDYPTLSELKRFVEERRPNARFEVETDIVRIV